MSYRVPQELVLMLMKDLWLVWLQSLLLLAHDIPLVLVVGGVLDLGVQQAVLQQST